MFISFEGIDGSGKSTQARLLTDALASLGYTVSSVREPGGTALGESVRELLLNRSSQVSPRAELLLFAASRAQLVDLVIEPALTRGEVVIADRFYDSSTAYQGGGHDIASLDWLTDFHQFVVNSRSPDRTYFLDIDPNQAYLRASERSELDRMESASADFFRRTAESYGALVDLFPDRILSLDANLTVEILHRTILADVLNKMNWECWP